MKIFIIAGEASGDWLGAKLIKSLREISPQAEFSIIGGKKMEEQGFKSLIPITELALMGFAEVLPHIPRLKRRMAQTAKAIIQFKPDVVITIDSPGFNFRVVAMLQKLRAQTKFVHYVAPTVWAYKPERAKKMAKLYDKLLCILPFEPPYFTEVGLDAKFVGHPIIEDGLDKGDPQAFRDKYEIADDFICLMPGSRKGELKRMLPVFEKITTQMEGMKFVIIAADYARFALEAAVAKWKNPPLIVDNSEKIDCFAASKAGIIKSGTSGLEYAFARKPYVVAYKVNPLSAYMLRRMIRISYYNLINILLDNEVVTELMQEDCEAEYIIDNLSSAIAKPNDLLAGCEEAIMMLHNDNEELPSKLAATEIIGITNA